MTGGLRSLVAARPGSKNPGSPSRVMRHRLNAARTRPVVRARTACLVLHARFWLTGVGFVLRS